MNVFLERKLTDTMAACGRKLIVHNFERLGANIVRRCEHAELRPVVSINFLYGYSYVSDRHVAI
jgi:hypothetical protein